METTRVRLLRRIASRVYGNREADSVLVMSAADAAQYIADGIAEPAGGATAVEADAAAMELRARRRRGARNVVR